MQNPLVLEERMNQSLTSLVKACGRFSRLSLICALILGVTLPLHTFWPAHAGSVVWNASLDASSINQADVTISSSDSLGPSLKLVGQF